MPGEALKILSWNIQKFGVKKASDDNFIKYVAQVIIDSGADFVAIMEIVGWMGQDIKNKLTSQLHNQTGIDWGGEESEMTPSKPNEQYVCLWKKDPLHQAVVKTYRILGENDFKQFAKSNKINQKTVEDALQSHGYLDDNYMVPEDKYDVLLRDSNNLDLTPQLTLTDAQKQEVVGILLSSEIIGFPYSGSRPPFLVGAKLNNGMKSAAVDSLLMVFHAPGPTGTWPMMACSMLALLPEVKTTKTSNQPAVIMGDFNIDWNESQRPYGLYVSASNGNPSLVRDSTGKALTSLPFQRLVGPEIVSSPKTIDPSLQWAVETLDYRMVLGEQQPTSITTTLVADDTVVANAGALANLLSSNYDNFFVRGGIRFANAKVVPLLDEMVPKTITLAGPPPSIVTRSTTATTYNQKAAQLAARAFGLWWDEQNSRGVKKPDIINPNKVANPITKIPADTPTSLRQAHYIYRYAISDHMPIYFDFEYA